MNDEQKKFEEFVQRNRDDHWCIFKPLTPIILEKQPKFKIAKKTRKTDMSKLITVLILIALTCSTVVLAVSYMTKNVSLGFKLKVIGKIGIYSDSACTVPFTTYDYPDFNDNEGKMCPFWVKNEGNIACKVIWYCVLASNPNWVQENGYTYAYKISTVTHWLMQIRDPSDILYWQISTDAKTLAVGEILSGYKFWIGEQNASVGTTYTITLTFEAQSV